MLNVLSRLWPLDKADMGEAFTATAVLFLMAAGFYTALMKPFLVAVLGL